MANENRYYKTPFAESGDKTEVPNVSTGGAVGYDTGFGPDYELPQGSPNRKRIERDMYNGVLNGVTKNLKQWQEGLYPTWIEDNGDGVAFSYSEGMVVNHTTQDWLSLEAGNQEEPGTGSKWIVKVSDINDITKTYKFPSVALMLSSLIVFPENKPLQVFDEATGLYSNYVSTTTVTALPLTAGLYAFPLVSSFDPSLTTAQAINNNKFDKSAPLGNALQVFAHRGFAEQFPQNTLVACSGAINVGAAGLELDAAVSSDDVTYLFHDETVDALTDGTGTFTNLTSAYIDTLKFTSTAGTILADEKIPRLIDVLNLCRNNGIYIMLELKLVDSLADIDLIIADIVASGMEHLVSLQSGNLTNVQYVRSVNSTLNVGYITAESTFQTYIDILAGLGNATVNIQHDVAFANPGMVNYARERGVDMVAYTLPDNIFTKRIQSIGIYKVIADRLVGEIHG